MPIHNTDGSLYSNGGNITHHLVSLYFIFYYVLELQGYNKFHVNLPRETDDMLAQATTAVSYSPFLQNKK